MFYYEENWLQKDDHKSKPTGPKVEVFKDEKETKDDNSSHDINSQERLDFRFSIFDLVYLSKYKRQKLLC